MSSRRWAGLVGNSLQERIRHGLSVDGLLAGYEARYEQNSDLCQRMPAL